MIDSTVVDAFVASHRALMLKHARAHVHAFGEAIPAEEVAREIELILKQLAAKGADVERLPSPDAVIRHLVRHAVGRAKRRHTLIEQVAAGDDLDAVAGDLAALDADLPPAPDPPGEDAKGARRMLDAVKRHLGTGDRLIFALLIEDNGNVQATAELLRTTPEMVEEARKRILAAAAEERVQAEADRRATPSPSTDLDGRREARLRTLGLMCGAESRPNNHVEVPILSLLRGGDQAADLDDAVQHLAVCVDCRARLTEGEIERRSLVVVAIEAPRASHEDLETAAEASGARLLERGDGRWTALVDAAKADLFRTDLEGKETSKITRLAVATPIDVPLDEPKPHSSRRSYPDDAPPPSSIGTAAAEVNAWVQIARKPRRAVAGPHPGWALFAVSSVGLAVALAYWLATR